jgi:hypothetical protein
VETQCAKLRPYGRNVVIGTDDTCNITVPEIIIYVKTFVLMFTGMMYMFLAESSHSDQTMHREWWRGTQKTE